MSDGIFAVAMTLLVLDLHVPVAQAVHSEHDLWRALAALAPRLVVYLLGFLTLGIFWVGQQTQLNHLTPFRSQPLVDPYRVSVCRQRDAFFYRPAGGVHRLPHRAARLLGQHRPSGRYPIQQLGVRGQKGLGEGRSPGGSSGGHLPPHLDWAIALCIRRAALRLQYPLEHRIHCSRAAQLRDRAAHSLAVASLTASENAKAKRVGGIR